MTQLKSNLIPYRVTVHEQPGEKFKLVFDCMAEDADHAAEQAENAYPGCEVVNVCIFDHCPNAYAIYSPNESACSDGAGFWSNEYGWTEVDSASTFSYTERMSLSLPMAAHDDVQWVMFADAKMHYSTRALH